MRGFRVLAIVTAIAVYGQIVLGGVVRITGSGLGCPDWPLCHGSIIPSTDYHTLIEYAHRAVGTGAGLLMLATAGVAVVLYRRGEEPGGVGLPRAVMVAAVAGVALIVLQGLVGGVTVLLKNSPFTVAIHLGNALFVLAAALTVALWAASPARLSTATGRVSGTIYGAAVAAYLIVISGAYVVGAGAGGACPDWPLCGVASRNGPADIHFLHRIVVLLASVVIVRATWVAHQRWGGTPLALAAYITAGLLILEVVVGAVQVRLGLPAYLRASHLAIATAVWSGIALMVAALWRETRPEPAGPMPMTASTLMGARP